MIDYIPMTGPLPGERYMPSNSTEGACFQDAWCSRCARDRELNGTVDWEDAGDDDWCPIIGASYMDKAVEWRELEDGSTMCAAFVPMGEAIPTPADEFTIPLFPESAP